MSEQPIEIRFHLLVNAQGQSSSVSQRYALALHQIRYSKFADEGSLGEDGSLDGLRHGSIPKEPSLRTTDSGSFQDDTQTKYNGERRRNKIRVFPALMLLS